MMVTCEFAKKPLLISSFEKILILLSRGSVSSTLGSRCTSLSTLWFSGLRSSQIRNLPFFLGTTTIPAHQRVGCDTSETTPAFSMWLSTSETIKKIVRTCLLATLNTVAI